MINTQRVQALIERPALVTADDREGLRGLVDRYPHSPGLAMLLARASQLAGHLDQQQDLLRAAAMLENREALFDLLVRPEILREARQVFDDTAPTTADQEPSVAPASPVAATPIETPPPIEAPIPEDSPKEVEPLVETEETPDAPAEPTAETDDLQREVLLTAIESTIELEVSEWEGEQRTEEPAPHSVEDMAPETPPTEKKTEGTMSYSDWLRQRAQAVSFGEVSTAAAEQDEQKSAETPRDVNVLIDRFLEAKPKIGPIRDVDRGVEDLAKQSVLEDRTLVTETMARVFAKQGQIGRAKRIYQELALKYPAKSTYFAAQLKKLGKGG